MTTGDKAKRATVAIALLSVDGFQMPDGSYRMSQTSALDQQLHDADLEPWQLPPSER